jgi:hypothetical protein
MGVDDLRIIAFRTLETNDPDKGIPTYKQIVKYFKNNTIQKGTGLDPTVLADQSRINFLKDEYRSVESIADWIKVGNPNAATKTLESLLIVTADAKEDCDRQLTLYSGRRDFMEVDVNLTFESIQYIDIGDTITLVMPYYGYNDGLPVIVTGMSYNAINNVLTYQVWGGFRSVVSELAAGINLQFGSITDTPGGWAQLGSLASPATDPEIQFGNIT